MVASIRPVARMSSAGVSWKPFGKRASGPVVLFDLAMQVTPSCGEWVAAAAYSGCGAEREGGAPEPRAGAPARLGEERAGPSAAASAGRGRGAANAAAGGFARGSAQRRRGE